MKKSHNLSIALLLITLWTTMFVTSCKSEEGYGANNVDEVILPAPDTMQDKELTTFFEAVLNASKFGVKPFFAETVENTFATINSKKDFSSIYNGEDGLPEIDFEKYTLIVGQVYAPGTNYSVSKLELISYKTSYKLMVFLEKPEYTFWAFTDIYYWKLYPKLDNRKIEVEVQQ